MKPKVIAFYLPQYHPTPTNNKWYGEGYTEWTNVGRAKKLFPGHYQPHIPADLGYYDLRLPEIREKQVELAKEAGIYGFCYYHYWFGNGREELERIFDEVVASGKPDFPFMLCWANETWRRKFWNPYANLDKNGRWGEDNIIVEQTYQGEKDNIDHFYRLLPAFKDKRYIKINGKLAFMVYKPLELLDQKDFIELWQELALKEGLPGFHFISNEARPLPKMNAEIYFNMGFDAINSVGIWYKKVQYEDKFLWKYFKNIIRKFNIPYAVEYKKMLPYFKTNIDALENVYPTLIPNWDHTPRSGKHGFLIHKSTPELWRLHIKDFFNIIKNKKEPILFLKSWNEWGEGNYMEPDLRFGHQYIEVLKEEIDKY